MASAIRPKGQAAFRSLYARYKARAKLKKLPFSLSHDDVVALCTSVCHYCGAFPQPYNLYQRKNGTLMPFRTQEAADRAWVNANGIDRQDSLKGYSIDNCVPCCHQCNYTKLDYTELEFIKHAYSIVAYQESLQRIKLA